MIQIWKKNSSRVKWNIWWTFSFFRCIWVIILSAQLRTWIIPWEIEKNSYLDVVDVYSDIPTLSKFCPFDRCVVVLVSYPVYTYSLWPLPFDFCVTIRNIQFLLLSRIAIEKIQNIKIYKFCIVYTLIFLLKLIYYFLVDA